MEKIYGVEYCETGIDKAYHSYDKALLDILKDYLLNLDGAFSADDTAEAVVKCITSEMKDLFEYGYIDNYAYIHSLEVVD